MAVLLLAKHLSSVDPYQTVVTTSRWTLWSNLHLTLTARASYFSILQTLLFKEMGQKHRCSATNQILQSARTLARQWRFHSGPGSAPRPLPTSTEVWQANSHGPSTALELPLMQQQALSVPFQIWDTPRKEPWNLDNSNVWVTRASLQQQLDPSQALWSELLSSRLANLSRAVKRPRWALRQVAMAPARLNCQRG